MAFWTYMLHCRGGYLYVGHTDNLERRVGQHQTGQVAGFASDHRPIELVWSQEFPSRMEALEAERRIKGWGREKKLALIRGDWAEISRLAKGKDSASTSSARTGTGMTQKLICHPEYRSSRVKGISAEIGLSSAGRLRLTFTVAGGGTVKLGDQRSPDRRDGLWQTTCFELFVRTGATSYCEFNFSPATEWAAYGFDNYRAGMFELPLRSTPTVEVARSPDSVRVSAMLDLWGLIDSSSAASLSAVIEETDGTKSYWALAHPLGKPDFHHPDCFALELPAPERS